MADYLKQEYPTNHGTFELNVASMLITKDSIFIAVGHAYKETDFTSVHLSQVRMSKVFEYPSTHEDTEGRRATREKDIQKSMAIIFQNAPLVEAICISAFGPFVKIGRHFRDSENYNDVDEYGLFPVVSNFPEWNDQWLYGMARDSAEYCHNEIYLEDRNDAHLEEPPKVIIGLDVNVAALGEHYYVLEEDLKIELNKDLRYKMQSRRALDRSPPASAHTEAVEAKKKIVKEIIEKYCRIGRRTTGYIKVSNSVNVGFTSNGWISRGRGHSQMSAFMPRRSITIDQESIHDNYPGTCNRHADCIEGLASFPALAKRFATLNPSLNSSEVTLSDIVEHHNVDHAIWRWTAYYISQLAHVVTTFIAPTRIALGGIVITGPAKNRKIGWEDFITKLQDGLEDLVWRNCKNGNPLLSIPNYPELTDIKSFLHYRKCNYPTLFGGLITARWDLTNHYPSPAEYMFDERNKDSGEEKNELEKDRKVSSR